MSRLTQRRFVFLDVDGLLIPLRTRPVASGRRSGGVRADLEGASGNPVLDRLDPQDGRRLLALDCPLVWATSWMGEANEVIAPRLGLPDLPVVEWPDTDDQPAPGLHWKTMFLTAGRPAARSYGTTTNSPTWIAGGSPHTIRHPRCCTESMHTWA